jgi:hypothetical protein
MAYAHDLGGATRIWCFFQRRILRANRLRAFTCRFGDSRQLDCRQLGSVAWVMRRASVTGSNTTPRRVIDILSHPFGNRDFTPGQAVRSRRDVITWRCPGAPYLRQPES